MFKLIPKDGFSCVGLTSVPKLVSLLPSEKNMLKPSTFDLDPLSGIAVQPSNIRFSPDSALGKCRKILPHILTKYFQCHQGDNSWDRA